ncbi:hypothetical protein HJG60_007167 [Phyllostomus discolor]|uniref:Uncharacterized protein n=1 Tax=Phyllostomus discolor TaxID=89673 RepID=A0A833YZ24_9CHIR|nr:hypothetical protein HJG60_007167 [Phyllostomus discolor]
MTSFLAYAIGKRPKMNSDVQNTFPSNNGALKILLN